MSEKEKLGRTMTGTVVSDKGDKTIVVMIERREKHPLYKKYVRRSSRIHAHDETNSAKMGDVVMITACRPRSKMKSWQLVNVVEKAR